MKKQTQLRTDFCDELIVQEHHDDTISCVISKTSNCKITHIKVVKEENILEKEMGDYVTIEFETMNDHIEREEIINCTLTKLNELIDLIRKKITKVLVIGLGNREVVSDALGPKCTQQILVTSHLYEEKRYELLDGTRNVALLAPGVMGQTGFESASLVKSISTMFKPDLIIVVDALATSSIKRINRAIQINNTGIKPGSGVGNHRNDISEKSLKIPVIAIGVATVTSVGTMVKEVLKRYEQEALFETIAIENEMNMIVTPKNMDDELTDLVAILSESINRSIHPNYEQL